MTRDVVIGLDLATVSGWAVYDLDANLLVSGVWDLSVRPGETSGWRWLRLNQRLTALLLARYDGRVAAIGVEDAFSGPTQEGGKKGMSKRSTAVLWGLRATVESVAALHGIPVVAYAQATVKKTYAGSGRASIASIIEIADRERQLKTGDNGTAAAVKRRSDEAIARGVAVTLLSANARHDLQAGRFTPKRKTKRAKKGKA